MAGIAGLGDILLKLDFSIMIETSERKALCPRGNTTDMQRHLVDTGNGEELSLDRKLGNVIWCLTGVSSE